LNAQSPHVGKRHRFSGDARTTPWGTRTFP
jgi:hypothetical protein